MASQPGEPTWPGLTTAGAVLLPNGWSLKPAGKTGTVGRLPGDDGRAPDPSRSWPSFTRGMASMRSLPSNAATGKTIARVTFKESFQGPGLVG